MKKISFFCIPAHGHTNPMLPVAAELVRRGNVVRFYSFDEFEEKIRVTGAEFISCGNAINRKELGTLPSHIQVHPYVDQLTVLAKSDVFITHCGMNSVSESLYMGTPMILYPQTNEQYAVARRVTEIGAGIMMKDEKMPRTYQTVLEVQIKNSSINMFLFFLRRKRLFLQLIKLSHTFFYRRTV